MLLLNKYPLHDSSKNAWAMILFFSLFIPVFLGVFQPFGISELKGPSKPFVLVGYGIITLLSMAFYLLVVKRWFNEHKWNVIKEITLTLVIVLTIGLLNYLYSSEVFDFQRFDVNRLGIFVGYTIAVGIMPIGMMVSIRQNLLYRVYSRSAEEINKKAAGRTSNSLQEKGCIVTILGDYNDTLEATTDDILYLESRGNHTLIYLMHQGRVEERRIRGSLSKIKSQLIPENHFFQTHRAFIVNLNYIQNVTGNAQGLKLSLSQTNVQLPVSRCQVFTFREAYMA